jgi:hypothetical protein
MSEQMDEEMNGQMDTKDGEMREDKKTEMMGDNPVGGKKKRKEPSILASWRKFVRKVQHEEKITYPKAMKRASKRKSEWQRGGADMGNEEQQMEEDDQMDQMGGSADVQDFDGQYKQLSKVGGRRSKRRSRRGGNPMIASPQMMGGSRRRRGTKKRRGSRRR